MLRVRIPRIGVQAVSTVSLGATESPDTASFSVGLRQAVALAATEAPDVAAVSVATRIGISLSATEASDVADFTVALRVGVTLGATEGPDIAAFAVGVVSAAPAINLTATEGADVADFSVAGPDIEQTGGGAGDYFTNVPNFARRWVDIRDELEEKPTPEVVREAARSIVQAKPDIEPAALQSLIDEQLRAYDLLSSLVVIAQEEARRELDRLQIIKQEEEEIQQAIKMFAAYMQSGDKSPQFNIVL